MTLDANDELASSASSEDTDVVSEAPANTETEADPSPAEGATEASTLDIVRDVVTEQAPAEAASPAEGSETAQQADEATKKEPDQENFSDVPFHKHPRFQDLLKQKKAFEVDAVRYRNVQNYLDQNGLNAEEAADGLMIMGLMKTDPAAAWDRLKPVVQNLLVAIGEVLPDDLSHRVQRGELPMEAAQEISRARAKAQTVESVQSFREQQAERARQMQHAQSLVDAANSWEADRRAKDPNFEAKLIPLQKEIAFLQMQEGRPTTAEGVRDQLRRAYEAVIPSQPVVSATVQRTKPTPRASMGGQSSGSAQPAPSTTLEIIRAARAGH